MGKDLEQLFKLYLQGTVILMSILVGAVASYLLTSNCNFKSVIHLFDCVYLPMLIKDTIILCVVFFFASLLILGTTFMFLFLLGVAIEPMIFLIWKVTRLFIKQKKYNVPLMSYLAKSWITQKNVQHGKLLFLLLFNILIMAGLPPKALIIFIIYNLFLVWYYYSSGKGKIKFWQYFI